MSQADLWISWEFLITIPLHTWLSSVTTFSLYTADLWAAIRFLIWRPQPWCWRMERWASGNGHNYWFPPLINSNFLFRQGVQGDHDLCTPGSPETNHPPRTSTIQHQGHHHGNHAIATPPFSTMINNLYLCTLFYIKFFPIAMILLCVLGAIIV